jgi:hypothetical protein
VASSLDGARDRNRRTFSRALRVAGGVLLLLVWVGIIALLGWLIAGGNPFCSGVYPFATDPCSGHGECYSAAQCRCEAKWGPESGISGTDLCSCPVRFIGEHCDRCDSGYAGKNCNHSFSDEPIISIRFGLDDGG